MTSQEQQLINLQKENRDLKRQLEKLKLSAGSSDQRKKNTRGAGRKPQNAAWIARYDSVRECVEENLSWQEATDRLKISRATYYRFREICLHDMRISERKE